MKKQERVALIKELKAKYGKSNATLKLMTSLQATYSLSELELDYIFFEDDFLSRFVNA